MPSFRPKTDKELAAENLLPIDPIYDFEVMGAELTRSKSSGNEMIALKVGVFTETGACRFVNDNLVFTEKAMFKVSQFCKATGLYERYKAGNLDAEDCKGRTGKLKLGIEPEGEFPAKNKVASYIIPKPANGEAAPRQAQSARVATDTQRPATPPVAANSDDSDAIPF